MRKIIGVMLIIIFIGMASCGSNEDKKYNNIHEAIQNNDIQAVKDFIRKNSTDADPKPQPEQPPNFPQISGLTLRKSCY